MTQALMIEANLAMQDFDLHRRREWMIYASRHQACPKCFASANQACINLSKQKRGVVEPTKNPHDERVDWSRLVDGLHQRGIGTPYEPPPFQEDPPETMPDWARP